MTTRNENNKQLTPLVRWFLFATGFIAVTLGVAGAFLPVLPTVPFLLLAVACFARSSERFYSWLLDHAHLGPMVKPYLDGRGLRKSTKAKAITLIWASITLSIFFLDKWFLQAGLVVIAMGVTLYLLRLPLLEEIN